MNELADFTNLYSLPKTLRFELKPIGKTLEKIKESGVLTNDEKRASSYIKVKEIIDEYHKAFIEHILCDVQLKNTNEERKDSLEEYFFYYNLQPKTEQQKKDFESIQSNLRKQISNSFTDNEQFKRIDKKELIKEDLFEFVKTIEEKELISEFKDFTTYFTGFHENRQNMYVADEKSTAIAYRLINQNLPKFIDNMTVFEKAQSVLGEEKIEHLYNDFKEYLNVNTLSEMFRLQYYTDLLTQTQIDVYNSIIGGRSEEDGKPKIQGLNEYINLYNQQQTDKKNRLPKLKPLYKQILSDRNTISFLPEEFKTDQETIESIEKCYRELEEQVLRKTKEGVHSLKTLLSDLNDFDLHKIYIRNDLSLTNNSQSLFGNWSVIQKAIEADFEKNNIQKAKETAEKYEERKDKFVKSFDSLSIGYIDECLMLLDEQYHIPIETYFKQLGAKNTETEQKEDLFTQIDNRYADIKDLLNTIYPDNKDLAQDKTNVYKIKLFLDSLKELQWFIKPLLGKGNEGDKDEKFYSEFSTFWDELDKVTPLYNKVRNYMTRKPYSEEKIKLNFENSTLLDGWDLNKEPDNTSVILRKEGMYYLGIMNKKHNKIFKSEHTPCIGAYYEKMEYKLLPGANKMLPKVFFSKSRIDEFKPSEKLLENYEKETHKKGPNFNINDCHDLIEFFKTSIQKHEDWKKFGFNFSDTKNYEDLSGFYREVEQQGYKLSFRKISEEYINQLIDEGKLYLFQIYNKDFSPFSKGTPNMHTLYWKMLFDEHNLNDVVYKLNGQAEVFYRKSSIKPENVITHPKNSAINNKNELNKKKKSIFDYDLIKDRRYTVDKFQFHVPITINFKALGINDINQQVNEYLKCAVDTHIIGIDRGERHLLYLTVIDSQGNIKEQFSLNEIVNEYKDENGKIQPVRTNYHDLLDKREGDRAQARQDWQTIENIKELKEGYLSQVIHKTCQLIVKYNAIVVLEDLNLGFMRGRQKVEKQVYQKFEKMLIEKLKFLADKKSSPSEAGGILNAYQLVNEKDKKNYKQSGFLFYIPAWNTSKMDPVTGYVNLFDTRYENVEKAKSFFSKFSRISYNDIKGWFEFEVKDYTQFSAKAEGTRQDWTVCTHGTRIETLRNPEKNNEWDNREFDMTQEFKDFFSNSKIDIKDNLKESIAKQTDKAFFEKLLHLFKLTIQMRNSRTGTDVDYLISPVANSKGEFYDSRTCGDNLPKNADANGAYNIARKGLWVIEQIKQIDDLKKLKLAISNKEWLQFAQK